MTQFDRIDHSAWSTACATLHREGLTWFGFLTAVDDLRAGSIDVLLAVATPGAAASGGVRTSLPRESPALPSVGRLWAGAHFAERECHEMFGIDFVGHPDLRPLLLPPGVSDPPLRADVGLARRAHTLWPGERDPGDQSSARRRRSRPLGSESDNWVISL